MLVGCAAVLSHKERDGRKTVAAEAFAKLEQLFGNLTVDIRRSNFQDIQTSFSRMKEQAEHLLNEAVADRKRLVSEFNRLAMQPIRSQDNNSFDVMAKISRSGQIELMFLEA